MSKLIIDSLVKIIKNNGEAVGTGFFINEDGLFITARHCIPNLNNTKDYLIVLSDNSRFTFKKINPDIDYLNNEIDILIFKAFFQMKKQHSFIEVKKIKLPTTGVCTIFGYPLENDKFRSDNFKIYGVLDNQNMLQLTKEEISIKTGCSGSPVFLLEKNIPVKLLGVMAHTPKDTKVINNIYSINLIEKLFITSINDMLKYDFFSEKKIININKKKTQKIQISKKCKKPNILVKYNKFSLKLNNKILESLHNGLEHKLIEIEQDLKKNYQHYSKADKRARLKRILKEFKKIFQILSRDVSVHIKLITEVDTDFNHGSLKSICRVRSDKEKSFDTRRSTSEKFLLTDETNISKLKDPNNIYLNQGVNSAYNQACVSDSKYWVCNNLESATKENTYFSTSDGYEKYYKSLVVFPIFDKEFEGKETKFEQIKGLLIIDSPDKGAFDKEHIKILGGYVTHKLNRLLSSVYFEDFFPTYCEI